MLNFRYILIITFVIILKVSSRNMSPQYMELNLKKSPGESSYTKDKSSLNIPSEDVELITESEEQENFQEQKKISNKLNKNSSEEIENFNVDINLINDNDDDSDEEGYSVLRYGNEIFDFKNEFCSTADENKAEISKIMMTPENRIIKTYWDSVEFLNQEKRYFFGRYNDMFSIISQINTSYSSSQKLNATIEICYPEKKNMLIKTCPLYGVNIIVQQKYGTGNVSITSGDMFHFIEKGQQFCITVEANNTQSYNINVDFYGYTKNNAIKFLKSEYPENGEIPEILVSRFVKSIDIYETMSETYLFLKKFVLN